MLLCGNIVLLTVRFTDVAKYTALTALSFILSYKLFFAIVGTEISYPPTLALKPPNKVPMRYLGNLSNMHFSFSEKLCFTSCDLA
jgi:hypothetical protein